MSIRTGLAWGNRVFANELGCHFYYDSDTARQLHVRALTIYRPSTTFYDWQSQFLPYMKVDAGGLALLGNEPDNAATQGGGEPAGDNMSPGQYVIFLVEAMRRWPYISWIGPNIVRLSSQSNDWLGRFCLRWKEHGYPQTGILSPFVGLNGESNWGVHVYGNGKGHAKGYLKWFVNTVQSYGHTIDNLWVTEYCHHDPEVLEGWTKDIRQHSKVHKFFVFSPWLENNANLVAAYKRGLT